MGFPKVFLDLFGFCWISQGFLHIRAGMCKKPWEIQKNPKEYKKTLGNPKNPKNPASPRPRAWPELGGGWIFWIFWISQGFFNCFWIRFFLISQGFLHSRAIILQIPFVPVCTDSFRLSSKLPFVQGRSCKDSLCLSSL